MWILKEILQAITTQPMLKIDTANCPSIEKLTDELELYRKYDTLSNTNSNIVVIFVINNFHYRIQL